MSFPSRIEFEPPTRADLRRVLRSWRAWILFASVTTLGISALLVARQHSQQDAAGSGILVITGAPSRARVEVDGRGRGETAAVLPVSPAPHRVTLPRDGYAPTTYSIEATAAQTTTLHADLWLQTPHVQRLRPTFPGALITHADFLQDGRVALTLFIPTGDEPQVWVVDAQGETQGVGPGDVHGVLSLSPLTPSHAPRTTHHVSRITFHVPPQVYHRLTPPMSDIPPPPNERPAQARARAGSMIPSLDYFFCASLPPSRSGWRAQWTCAGTLAPGSARSSSLLDPVQAR